jgi:hypothetical protein
MERQSLGQESEGGEMQQWTQMGLMMRINAIHSMTFLIKEA